MRKRLLAMVLAAAMVSALAVPAGAAEPYTMLEHIAYYGDRSKCAMTAEQAQAFLEVIESEMEKESPYSHGTLVSKESYAALFDTGNGIPALCFAKKYNWDNGDVTLHSYGESSIWTYQNGEIVPFSPEVRGEISLFDSCVSTSYSTPDIYYTIREIYPFADGELSHTPVHTIQFWNEWNEDGTYGLYQIDGSDATEAQVTALQEEWFGRGNIQDNWLFNIDANTAFLYYISGLTLIDDVKIALGAYITAAQGSTRVQLHLNGGSGGSALWSNASGTVQVPTNPTREGYTFAGWYTDEGFTTPWNFNFAVTGELTLYAKWTPVSSTAATVGQNTQDISFNGSKVAVQGYTLRADNGGDVTYVKLRDIAALMDGTSAQFNVDWRNGAIYVERGRAYTTRNGTELKPITGTDGSYQWNTAPILFDGTTTAMEGIVLEGTEGNHTFLKLRDLADAIGFTVGWSAESGITIEAK